MKLLARVCVALLLAVTVTFGGFYSNANALPVNHDGIGQILKADPPSSNKWISTDDYSFAIEAHTPIQQPLQDDEDDVDDDY